jgi:putative oxidoreductase
MGKDLIQAFARLAVGIGFLSAVCDRFGFWGPHGTAHVAWGDFAHFTTYTAQVNSFLPSGLAPTLAIISTILESLFGAALVLGLFTRVAAIGSACLLALFAVSMTISFGIKAPLDYSVFAACSAALMLTQWYRFRWSIDDLVAHKYQMTPTNRTITP